MKMSRFIKFGIFALVVGTLWQVKAQTCSGGNCTANSCNSTDVQNCINSTSAGHSCSIPAGTCTWTSGVSASGINISGAGTSRIIAVVANQAMSLSAGSQTVTLTNGDPGVSSIPITNGQTLLFSEEGTPTNFLQGTVTSFNSTSNSITMSFGTAAGACGSNSLSNCKRWLVSTVPPTYTAIIDNDPGSSGPLFNLTESSVNRTTLSNIWFQAGTYSNNAVVFNYGSSPSTGQPIVVHDCRVDDNGNNPGPPSGNATMIYVNTVRGLVYNCSFQAYPYNISTLGAISVQDDPNTSGNSWTSASNMGAAGNGSFEFYAEDNDYHAMNYATSTDQNGRAAWRYSLYDNSGIGTHGADTGNYGQRYFELYNNTFVFEGYNDGTTFPMNDWIFLRGGTGLVYNNTMPALTSTDYGTKSDVNMTVMNLQRSAGPDPCWGAGHTTATGQNYHAPRQVGFGYVTGTGSTSYSGASPNPLVAVNGTVDSVTYVGDSEPFYIWGNSRSLLNVGVSDYGGTDCSNPDSSGNYIQSGRDFFNSATAKPGWSPYAYPNPLRGGGVATQSPAPPTNLQATPNSN